MSRIDATNFGFVSCDPCEEVGPTGGATMSDGFLNIDSTGITRRVSLSWGHYSDRADDMPAGRLRTAIGWLPIAVILAAASSLLASEAWHAMANKPVRPTAAIAATPTSAATIGMAKEPAFDPSVSEAIVPEQPAPVDRLKIASQSWHRGGLGSNALVTMTLRNDNSYTVRDIDISCAFQRPDGSYVTSRSRMLPDVVNMKSRKTFARLHVGFVNVNATKAKCSLVAASHI
ncbi:MAG TPA: hypothetical protein VFL62_15660 [Bradyrhizobium sp.]|uniref:hypothetical protein n=1 Tax=Bradyrhizobium sp. TaxID=376 RepID=UPI002D803289|nr:hypothetical protein [Bradyrhizobium sp.]HET7887660.1 hypothetical protein [Bradyrhizobium sp.]